MVRKFKLLKLSLTAKSQFDKFTVAVQEYFEMVHAEAVPMTELDKAPTNIYYPLMHMVRKESSTTTKLRVIFDASAKSKFGVSFNNRLLIGPSVKASVINMLLRFR